MSTPRSIPLPSSAAKYTKILGGPPDTMRMSSGYVVLSPGESVGLHNSGDREEIIIPLSGVGELNVPGMDTLLVSPDCVLYIPPRTPHDVTNIGDRPLRYIYVVAQA